MSETKRAYFTYMVRCADGTLYTGFTVDDVHRRIAMHNAGKGAKYTKSRRPVELVWYHEWESEHEARSAEYHTKKLSRREKEELVKKFSHQSPVTSHEVSLVHFPKGAAIDTYKSFCKEN